MALEVAVDGGQKHFEDYDRQNLNHLEQIVRNLYFNNAGCEGSLTIQV